ncbi:MAG TPA: hypothetical protein PKE47_03710 [Verrucomicrobiota bacterium]|nr:hypothetical protein [Verrucomicrobiota bacterium]
MSSGCRARVRTPHGFPLAGILLCLSLSPPRAEAQPFAGDLIAGFQSPFPTNAIIQAVAERPDGGLYVGGAFFNVGGLPRTNIVLLRANGTVDPGFNPGTGLDAQAFVLAMQGDKVLVGGSFGFYNGFVAYNLIRLQTNGQPDASFVGNDLINLLGTSVQAIRLAPDGKILVGGQFSRQNRIGRRNLARLHPDGSVDAGFDAGDTTDRAVTAIALQSDGRILYAGQRLGRLLPNGAPDPSFAGGAGSTLAYDTVNDLHLDSAGRILCVGSFTSVDGAFLGGIVRLSADGTRDTSFQFAGGTDGQIRRVHPLADGTLLIGGEFTQVGPWQRRSVARLLANGAVDMNFRADLAITDIGTVLYSTARTFVQTATGNVYLGGIFSALNGTPMAGMALISAGQTNNRPPRVQAGGGVLRVPESTDAVLAARVDGQPAPGIRWLYGLNSIGSTNSDTLTLGNVTAAAGGEYSLVLQNSLGTVTQLVAHLEGGNLPASPGHVHPAFYPGSGPGPRTKIAAPSYAYAVAPLPDGGAVVGGLFSNFNQRAAVGLVRLTSAGQPDAGFPAGGSGPAGASPSIQPEIRQVERQPDGRLLVAGTHATFSGAAKPGLTRLLADGSVDTTFPPASGTRRKVAAGRPVHPHPRTPDRRFCAPRG